MSGAPWPEGGQQRMPQQAALQAARNPVAPSGACLACIHTQAHMFILSLKGLILIGVELPWRGCMAGSKQGAWLASGSIRRLHTAHPVHVWG